MFIPYWLLCLIPWAIASVGFLFGWCLRVGMERGNSEVREP